MLNTRLNLTTPTFTTFGRPQALGLPSSMSTSFAPRTGDSVMLSQLSLLMNQMMQLMMGMMRSVQGGQMVPMPAGGPHQQFLGQGPNFGQPGASGAAYSNPAQGHNLPGQQGQPALSPANGRIGNINISRLIQALPASRRRSAQQHFPVIIQEAQRQGVTNKAQLAYILATATHESGAGAFMEEFASGRAYEGRGDLGNNRRGDGVRFKGRGYVQLTGRRNYRDWSRRLGIDIVSNPDRVKDPRIAARILVEGMMKGTFTGKGLGSYINDQRTDFRNARRTVNGTDRANHIGSIAQRLLRAM